MSSVVDQGDQRSPFTDSRDWLGCGVIVAGAPQLVEVGVMSRDRRSGWQLMGRTEELELIARSRSGGGSGVVVLGPAGVGKSRLAREALAGAQRGGARTAWLQATQSAASVPLGAFAGVSLGDARSDDLLDLMRCSLGALRDLAGRGKLVLGVDDAQLLDPASAALVLQLAITGTAFVVATLRAGEARPDAITALWKRNLSS